MIQRIQSIYLLLAAIVAIAFLFIPSLEIHDTYLTSLIFEPLLIVQIVVAALSLIIIFLFKNRTLQVNLNRLALLVIVAVFGLFLYYEFSDNDFQPHYGAATLLLLPIFNILATRAIRGDEKLVRSMDRLR